MQVHGKGDARIDGILELIEEASRNAPLPEVLQNMAEAVAVIGHADVVSVYVRDDHDELVLRANVGFPSEAVGTLRLSPGEGITGFACECLRPVTALSAEQDTHYKHFPELGEERFPCFLAVPLLSGGRALGVLNLQRGRDSELTATEVALAAALASPFALALERDAARGAGSSEPPEVSRSARLTGIGISGQRAIGTARSMPGFRALSEPDVAASAITEAVDGAFNRVGAQLERAAQKLDAGLSADDRRALAALQVTLQDQRMVSLARQTCERLGIVAGLRSVAREYAVAPYRIGDGQADPWLSARAEETEDLCLWLAAESCSNPGPRAGQVAIAADRLGAFAVLYAVSNQITAVVVGGPVETESLAAHLARAAKLPVVSEVAGLFAWVREDDTLIVDGEHGLVRVNPPASALALHRHSQ